MWDAIVIGGGCAGLACATSLAEHEKKVLVLERRPLLGGRASSFHDKTTGETIDNGQHLFLGCYEETKTFLRRIRSIQHLNFYDRFDSMMVGPDGEKASLKAGPFPAPWHLAWALLRYRALSLKERWALLRVIRGVQSSRNLENQTVDQWLEQLGQSQRSRSRLWDLLTLATLNIDPKQAPAELFATVLREGFLSSKSASSVGLSRVGLSDLHGEPSERFLMSKGGEVRRKTTVRWVLSDRKKISGVEFAEGGREEAKVFVSAVPPPETRALVSGSDSELSSFLSPTTELIPSPIVTVNVWMNKKPFDEVFVGYWDQPFHWAFQKSIISNSQNERHVALVTSGATGMIGRPKAELQKLAENQLKAKVQYMVVGHEAEATWIPPLHSRRSRLPSQTPRPNFFLAGDWVDTGLPCTIESAVKSGHMAARHALAYLGN